MRAIRLNVTAENIKKYLRIEHNDDDSDISEMILEAESEARAFLNTDFHRYTDSGELLEERPAPAAVNGWIKKRVMEKYEGRDGQGPPDFTELKPYRIFPMGRMVSRARRRGFGDRDGLRLGACECEYTEYE